MREYLIHDFLGAQIIADTHYEIANQVIKEVYPNSLVKFFTLIIKPRRKKQKRVENIKEDISVGATTLIAKQETRTNKWHMFEQEWKVYLGLSKPNEKVLVQFFLVMLNNMIALYK
jgi:Glu-tRNA(Gln) amidotransferase subunit E-like FAD-binding protein